MNILWITNIPLPDASSLMGEKPIPFGGWLVNAASELIKEQNIVLNVAFPKNDIDKVEVIKGENINYYPFPSVNYSDKASMKENANLINIIDESKPDIVHIFGTEFPHTLAMVNVCNLKGITTIISVQGLVSVIAKHYITGLPIQLLNRFTFRDFLKQDNIKQQQRKFEKRGKYEIEALQKVSHIIGRTTWDRACTSFINEDAHYHHCNETLRDVFYRHRWDINQCEKYSIFLSQGSYPIKGLHFVIESLPLLLKRYPNVKLYVGGIDITKYSTLKEKLKISSYGKYIKDLINIHNLQNHIIFTGILNEKQMCELYLKSHVFVCPSSIENSPNSLGEAMMLGVPSVASDVGGIADLLKHKEEGFLYQSDAPYMLAHYICEIFGDDQLALEFSENARKKALKRHDRKLNNERLKEIYHTLMEQQSALPCKVMSIQ